MDRIRNFLLADDEAIEGLIEAIPDACYLKDGEGRWIAANSAAKRLFQLQQVAWRGLTDGELAELFPHMAYTYLKSMQDDALTWNAGKLLLFEKQFVDHVGTTCLYEVRKSPVFDKGGNRLGLVTLCHDKTAQRLAEQNMRITDAAFDLLEAIVITDADQQILRVNHAFTRMTGYTPEEVIGKTPAILKSGRHDASFFAAMWNSLLQKKVWRGEIWDKRKNGEIYPKWLTISAVADEKGNIRNYVGTFTDLSEQAEMKDAIRRLAFYDALTDLPNRRLLCDQLGNALANSYCSQHYGALLMLDLDDFKRINDTKGHAVGDQLLVEVARRLRQSVREEDTVARLGGDEFVVLLEFLSQDAEHAAQQAQVVAEKILREISRPYILSGTSCTTTVSIGISLFDLPDATSDELLKRADNAMYQAKSKGRNTLCFFTPEP